MIIFAIVVTIVCVCLMGMTLFDYLEGAMIGAAASLILGIGMFVIVMTWAFELNIEEKHQLSLEQLQSSLVKMQAERITELETQLQACQESHLEKE